jgi:hypothetical protein
MIKNPKRQDTVETFVGQMLPIFFLALSMIIRKYVIGGMRKNLEPLGDSSLAEEL